MDCGGWAMSRVMVALASGQRMQNVIPVFQRGLEFEKVYLIRSADADQPGSAFARAVSDVKETLESLASVKVEMSDPAVGAYAVEDTRRVTAGIIQKETPAEVVVNFTGGTKCMSIGAFLAAREGGATSLYVDTADEKLVWFPPNGEVREEPFDLRGRLTVPVQLSSNGRRIDEQRTRRQALPAPAYQLARELLGLWPQCVPTLDEFGRAISQGQKRLSNTGLDVQVTELLRKYRFIGAVADGSWEITPQGRAVLTGKWLEALVYVLLEGSGYFDDVMVNVCLSGFENELDVVVARNGQLAVIECKSGDLGGMTTLNKLQAIRTTLGIFARGFFVTSRTVDQVDNSFRVRASGYGIRSIITAEQLLQVADKIREGMRGPS